MPRNHDLDIQLASGVDRLPVLESNFSELKIFWGPNQLNTGYSSYSPPSDGDWRHLEQLNIPQVVRFLHNGDTEFDTDQFNDPGGGGGTPITYTWVVVGYDFGPHDGTQSLFVRWRITIPPFFESHCPTFTLDTFDNYNAMVTEFPLGLTRTSLSGVFPCGDVMS